MGIRGWSCMILLTTTATNGCCGFPTTTTTTTTSTCRRRTRYNNHHHYYYFIRQLVVAAAAETDADTTSDTTPTTTTDTISFTLPRFLPPGDEEIDDDDEGGGGSLLSSYPSPLHSVHVKSILTDDEVDRCRKLSYEYAAKTGCWDQPDIERHVTYSTCDFPIEDNEELATYLHEIKFDERIFANLAELYGLQQQYSSSSQNPSSCIMGYLDFFVAQYQANNNDDDDDDDGTTTTTTSKKKKTMDRLEAHRDGSLLSFTILLNNPSEFEGGGTFFEGLRDVVQSDESSPVLQPGGVIQPQRAGDATFHSGKLLHGAKVITKGKRTVLVGFVDVADHLQRPGVISEACKDWGRMDAAVFRHERQLAKTKNGTKPGWFLNNARWIQAPTNRMENQGRSCLRGYTPAFPSVERRADPEYQRQKKLETEDRLLRSILLPEDEIVDPTQRFELLDGGDITIL